MSASVDVAFVLGGGGVLGASEVGMLQALHQRSIRADLVVGTSVGAINGAMHAAYPDDSAELGVLWQSMTSSSVFGGSARQRIRHMTRTPISLHGNQALRDLLDTRLKGLEFADLKIPFECCAASIERAAEHWFSDGPLVDAILASSAVPGLFPPMRIGDEHFLDGGLVNSIPIARAISRGARTVYVLQVGRVERELGPPTRPWEVATVSFEIARRHRFARDLAEVPEGVRVHVLPSGDTETSLASLRYRNTAAVPRRIEQARLATAAYLEAPEV
ncbi:patatin-like phospholipase family protein [Angustibacter sp. McL0619]|uniref:patatin-like phospholipase family protein n=1 Tax=Angustibacter sp. McL0619 TaxID=3415676 RepID=UPI003CEDC201